MSLHEEYIVRNKLSVPIVRYLKRTGVYLRSQNSSKIRVLYFNWHDNANHPGYYWKTYYESDKQEIYRELEYEKVFTDTYESAVLTSVEKIRNGKFYAPKVEEQILTAWSFFLFGYDSFLANKASQTFFDNLSRTVAPSLSIKTRLKFLSMCENYLLKKFPIISLSWKKDILGMATPKTSEWLIKLINNE